MAARKVLAIVADEFDGPEPVDEIRKCGEADGVDLRVVVPAVEATPFRHTLGDVDEPRHEAEERLRLILGRLHDQGIEAAGEVGDPDPVQAAQDALLKAPADEVLFFEHEGDQAKWFEEGLADRAKAGIEPPLRLVILHGESDGTEHVTEVEQSSAGVDRLDREEVVGSSYGLNLTKPEFAGILMGIVGTIAAIILAAALTAKGGNLTGAQAAAILIAIGIALVNMAHVVGLLLMDSVRYHGGFAKFFRNLALIGTPVAVIANLVLLVVN